MFTYFYQLYDEDLYKKSKILKLMACGKCDAPVADKYIECDGTLLLIDLVSHLSANNFMNFINGFFFISSLSRDLYLSEVLFLS